MLAVLTLRQLHMSQSSSRHLHSSGDAGTDRQLDGKAHRKSVRSLSVKLSRAAMAPAGRHERMKCLKGVIHC